MFLLCGCGGLRCGIAALYGLGVGRYGLGVVLDDGYGLVEWWFSESGFSGLGRCWGIVFTL